jgi:hypothetical protein
MIVVHDVVAGKWGEHPPVSSLPSVRKADLQITSPQSSIITLAFSVSRRPVYIGMTLGHVERNLPLSLAMLAAACQDRLHVIAGRSPRQ